MLFRLAQVYKKKGKVPVLLRKDELLLGEGIEFHCRHSKKKLHNPSKKKCPCNSMKKFITAIQGDSSPEDKLFIYFLLS